LMSSAWAAAGTAKIAPSEIPAPTVVRLRIRVLPFLPLEVARPYLHERAPSRR
jgi:hypothetical protein